MIKVNMQFASRIRCAFGEWSRGIIQYKLPWTNRNKIILAQKRENLLLDILSYPVFAQLTVVKAPLEDLQGQDVCLFVTHAPRMTLKKHVVHHLKFLLSAGLKVILIINSDEPKLPFLGYMSLKDDLCGIYVRENIGLDFPAWGQVFSLQSETDKWARLYLVNDSIAGPIDSASFDYMMQRIRSLDADMIGLVANDMPRYHLQSFFLVFGENVLRCAEFRQYFDNIRVFPNKQLVIDVYETRLTQYLNNLGFTAKPIYFFDRTYQHLSDHTLNRWEELTVAGVPYIKTSVIRDAKVGARSGIQKIRQLLPELWGEI